MTQTEADRSFHDYRASGKPEHLARVFDLCAPQLLLFASHVAGDAGVSEDLVQMTFLRAIERAAQFEAGRPVLPWLVGILVLEAKKQRRQSARSPEVDRLVDRGIERVPIEVAELNEFQAALTDAIEGLPQAYREVLTLRLIHGLEATAIAHLRGVSPETIKSQLRRGTKRLRRRLPSSFATVLVAVAGTGSLLAHARVNVLAAAQAAAGAAAATAGTAAVVAALGQTAVESTVSASVATALIDVPTPAGAGKVLAWVGGLAAVALGVVALSSGDDPSLDLPEVRREILAGPPREVPLLRGVATVDGDPKTAAPAVAKGASFVGRVVRPDGLGVPGIDVELIRLHPDALVVPAAPLPGRTTAPPFFAGSTRTDDLGRFGIHGVVPAGIFVLVIDANGERRDLRFVDTVPMPGQTVALPHLELGPRHVVHGRIVDERGDPIAGARLRHAGRPWQRSGELGLIGPVLEQMCADDFEPDGVLLAEWGNCQQVLTVPPWFRTLYDRLIARTLTTGADGRFTWVTPYPDPLTLTVSAGGFAPRRIGLRAAVDPIDAGNFQLERVGGVSGLVVDPNGNPVPGAEVMLARVDDAKCVPARLLAVTDEEGDFHAPWDGRRRVRALVRRGAGEPWFVTQSMSSEQRLVVALPRRFDVVVHMATRSETLEAPVFRLVPGELVPEIPTGVRTLHQLGFVDGFDPKVGGFDERRGVVRLLDVPAGDWILLACAPGHAATAVPLKVDGLEQVYVELAVLEPTTLTVEDAAFRRLAGVPVFARAVDDAARVREFPVMIGHTGSDGVLHPPAARWLPHSIGAALPEGGRVFGLAGAGGARVTLPIAATGSIEGRVTERGEPAGPGSFVLMARPVPRPGETPPAFSTIGVLSPVGSFGRFRFPALPPGDWRLHAFKSPKLLHPSHLLPLLFPAPAVASVRDLTLVARERARITFETFVPPKPIEEAEPEPVPDTLRGTVLVDGRPPRGLRIGVERAGNWSWFGLDGAGAFETGFLPNGSLRVAVVAELPRAAPLGAAAPDEYLWLKRVAFAADQKPVLDINLFALRLICWLQTAKGKRAPGVDVVLDGVLGPGATPKAGAPRSRFRVRADDGGRFEFGIVPEGSYAIRGEHARLGWLAKDEQRLSSDQVTLVLDFRLEPLLVASGHALPRALDLELPRMSRVEFVRVGGGSTALTRPGWFTGRGKIRPFRVDGLLPGKYRVTLLPALLRGNGSGGFYLIPPERAKLRVPQGTIDIGMTGRSDIVLKQPLPPRRGKKKP